MLNASDFPSDAFVLNCRGQELDCRPGLDTGAQVMGILNVTPDSFSDGGQFFDVDAAVQRVGVMLDEGATIIDVGGESSRPAGSAYGEGAAAVDVEEELNRILPVIRAIRETHPSAIISVDTYKAKTAEKALEAGAHIINDITGLRYGTDLATVCADAGAPLILMHSLGKPGAMPHEHTYGDVVGEVRAALRDAARKATNAGVNQVVLDPGFGFGKTAAENLRLLGASSELLKEGHPVLVGISRKSTIGRALGSVEEPAPIPERLFGTLGATAAAVLRGASIVRTHDVRPTVEMLQLFATTLKSAPETTSPA